MNKKQIKTKGTDDGLSTKPANCGYTVLATVLDEMIDYIEETDQQIEWEWGACRSLQEVKDAKDMPDIYYKLIAIRNGD